MAKKLDPRLLDILTKYDERPEDALWDCHGTWVAYHKAIERIAAKAGVKFDLPTIVEADTAAKTVSIVVAGTMGERREWSFGEAAPANNKNAYPYSMAEKRGKDRVVLKLVGLHGLVYSEEESDDFKTNGPRTSAPVEDTATVVKSSAQLKRDGFWPTFEAELDECDTLVKLEKFKAAWRDKAIKDGWNAAFKSAAKDRIEGQEKRIMDVMDAQELSGVPLDTALRQSLKQHPINAG